MKKKILVSIIISAIVIAGTGSYLLVHFLTTNYFDIENVEIINNQILVEDKPAFYKGETVDFSIKLRERGKPVIDFDFFQIQVNIFGEDYGLNTTAFFDVRSIPEILVGEIYSVIVLPIGPAINTSAGLFALNVGEYQIDSIKIAYNTKKPIIEIRTVFSFYIINPPQEEQVLNNGFEGLEGWSINGENERINVDTTGSTPLTGESLLLYVNQAITESNTSSISISQNVNLTNTHYLTFDQDVIGTNVDMKVVLFIDDEENERNLTLNEASSTEQLIHFGYFNGIANVTLQIIFTGAESGTQFYLDNVSILNYEHRVFVVMLNDNWEWHEDEKIRDSLNVTIDRASIFFEKDLGIKLIPVLELDWTPTSTRMAVVDELARADAGEKLNLTADWDVVYGRSPENHGFDLLTCFSNQSSEHYGFAYYKLNIALHFAQSEELGDYSWLAIVNDWAENIVQHEISHNFGALDRYRPDDPPSIMSKPITADQAIADFLVNRSWFQVNNWLGGDILRIIENKAMFD